VVNERYRTVTQSKVIVNWEPVDIKEYSLDNGINVGLRVGKRFYRVYHRESGQGKVYDSDTGKMSTNLVSLYDDEGAYKYTELGDNPQLEAMEIFIRLFNI